MPHDIEIILDRLTREPWGTVYQSLSRQDKHLTTSMLNLDSESFIKVSSDGQAYLFYPVGYRNWVAHSIGSPKL